MPRIAETTTARFCSARAAMSPATLRKHAASATLVPPNLWTTQLIAEDSPYFAAPAISRRMASIVAR